MGGRIHTDTTSTLHCNYFRQYKKSKTKTIWIMHRYPQVYIIHIICNGGVYWSDMTGLKNNKLCMFFCITYFLTKYARKTYFWRLNTLVSDKQHKNDKLYWTSNSWSLCVRNYKYATDQYSLLLSVSCSVCQPKPRCQTGLFERRVSEFHLSLLKRWRTEYALWRNASSYFDLRLGRANNQNYKETNMT